MRLKPTALVIDDDPSFRKALEVVLGRLGLGVKAVPDTSEFLELADKLRPDLYLIDLQLGEIHGNELITALRQTLGITDTIIIISGQADQAAIAHSLELGANDFLVKPIDRVLLASKLAAYVKTDEIESHRSEMAILPEGRVTAKMSFDGQIVGLDELGVRIQSASLLPKGTVLKLGTDLLIQMGASGSEVLVAVTSTELVPGTDLYETYAEFDGVEPDFLQLVRNWLDTTENRTSN